MHWSARDIWVWVLIAWIGVIFSSSTSLAGKTSEQLFSYLSELLFPELHTETSSYATLHFVADKGVHVFLFCVLGILLWKELSKMGVGRKIATALLLGAIVGSCSEILQRFFPGRDPAITDVLINVGATAIGLAGCVFFARRAGVRDEVGAGTEWK